MDSCEWISPTYIQLRQILCRVFVDPTARGTELRKKPFESSMQDRDLPSTPSTPGTPGTPASPSTPVHRTTGPQDHRTTEHARHDPVTWETGLKTAVTSMVSRWVPSDPFESLAHGPYGPWPMGHMAHVETSPPSRADSVQRTRGRSVLSMSRSPYQYVVRRTTITRQVSVQHA